MAFIENCNMKCFILLNNVDNQDSITYNIICTNITLSHVIQLSLLEIDGQSLTSFTSEVKEELLTMGF